jgi:hypothetical protein
MPFGQTFRYGRLIKAWGLVVQLKIWREGLHGVGVAQDPPGGAPLLHLA